MNNLEKRILIVKVDHIGDYIVLRELLSSIKKSKKFSGYKVTYLLNQRVKDLAIYLDSDNVDNFIFMELDKYALGDWYSERKNQEIIQQEYSLVLNATFFRSVILEQLLAKINCTNKILLKEKDYDKNDFFKKNYDNFYTNIIDLSPIKEFEFDKFKYGFEQVIKESIPIPKPTIELKNSWHSNLPFTFEYITVFIGSDSMYRKWDIYKYIEVIDHILSSTSLHVILCGAASEEDDARVIEQKLRNKKFHNLVSQTSLIDMLYILSNTKTLISNETGIAHMSIALDVYTLVISNGNHFGKFTPYPESYTKKYFSIYPFGYNNLDFDKYKQQYYSGSTLNINTISSSDVLGLLHLIFKELNIELANCTSKKQDNYLKLSPAQETLNYSFSAVYSKVCTDVLKLKETKERFIVYGDGFFGKNISAILGNCCIGILNIENLHTIDSFDYNKIIICVLGRENEIEEHLLKYNISSEKIIKLKIVKGSYNVRAK